MAKLSLAAACLMALLSFALADTGRELLLEKGTGTDIEDLDAECTSQINNLWLKYTNSSGVEGCHQGCLTECYDILMKAIWSSKNKNCPLQSDIQRCFHVFSDEWEEYVKTCELFAWTSSESESEGESSESEGEASSSAEGEASSSSAEGEASSTSSEAEASSKGRRRLLSEAESEGEGVAGGGCFPDFVDAEDFEKYIDGQWEFDGSNNAAGIALSVAFFVGLVGLALFLKS